MNSLAHSYMAFNTCYADTGLWGMYLTAEPNNLPGLMGAINREFVRCVACCLCVCVCVCV